MTFFVVSEFTRHCLVFTLAGLRVTVTISLGEVNVTEVLSLVNCSSIRGALTSLL